MRPTSPPLRSALPAFRPQLLRGIAKAILVTATAFLSFGAEIGDAKTRDGDAPNVVLIMVDDLGYYDLGCYGHPKIDTPVLDKLADEGIRLTNFHTGATVCTPSRMALLTGAYPTRVGWTRGVMGYLISTRKGLNPKVLTMAEVFRQAGYRTGISGKWHLGERPPFRPHRQGFDWSYYVCSSNNQTDELYRLDKLIEKPFDNRLLTEQFTEAAIGFIEKNKDQPFFLYVPYTAPHFPVEAHPQWKGKSGFGAYGDVVEEVDYRIGEILGALKEAGIADNTITVFLSDNGPQPGDLSRATPFRGTKWTSLEGGTRVPCIVNWPGHIPAGRESNALIAAIDLLPTLSRACDIDLGAISNDSPTIDGVDVLDTLTGDGNAPHPREELLYWHGKEGFQAIRVGQWKLFLDRPDALLPAEGDGAGKKTDDAGEARPALFNLSEDVDETNDVSEEHPEIVERLRKRARERLRDIKSDVIPLAEDVPGQSARQSAKPSGGDPPRPNIVLVMSDDMGYSDLGCYGGEISTPNLDQLARGGLRYTQFYNTGRCCPTRASLLTGLYAHQAGIGQMTNDSGQEGYRGNLSFEAVTLAEVLKSAGYHTYMSGKWHVTKHLNPNGNKDNWPLQRGFERFYGTIIGAGSFFDPWTLTRGNKAITPENDEQYDPEQYYYTDAISDNAVAFVEDHCRAGGEKPFFLYMAYTAAHWPMHALEKDIAKYKGKYDEGYHAIRRARYERMNQMGLIKDDWELSPAPQSWDEFPEERKAWELRCMEVYAAMVDNMDQGIGRLVRTLKEHDRFDNTLILFLQDNGGCAEGMGRRPRRNRAEGVVPMGEDELQTSMVPRRTRDGHPVLQGPQVMPGPAATYIAYGRNWANVSNTPFRYYKASNHEGGIATPLIAHWPKGIKSTNELRRQVGHLIDIMPTCVELSGADYPNRRRGRDIQPMEGRSLVPSFNSDETVDRLLMWEHFGNRAIRQGKWKLVALRGQPWELYDMERDRSEMHDLTDQHPEKAKELAALWEKHARRTKIYPKPE